jgi:outer membrane cobalamin receptor
MAMSAKPVIDVNLGAQYNVNKWLSCYIQLNNIIHRKHDIVYGYQTQGINFLLGVSYAF